MSKENGFVDVSSIEKCQELIAHQAVRIAELEQENESYQKLINDICNKFRVGSLKELEKKLAEQPKAIVEKIKNTATCQTNQECWYNKETKQYEEGEVFWEYIIDDEFLDTILKEYSNEN